MRRESCKLRSPPPTPPPLVVTLPKVELVGLKFTPPPLPPPQFGWLMKLNASARNWKRNLSLMGMALNRPRFQFWYPGWWIRLRTRAVLKVPAAGLAKTEVSNHWPVVPKVPIILGVPLTT